MAMSKFFLKAELAFAGSSSCGGKGFSNEKAAQPHTIAPLSFYGAEAGI